MKTFVFTLLFIVLVIVFSFEKVEAIEDIVIALSFEEVEGEVVKDLSPHGNDGTLMGELKQVDGRIGKALEFDGDNYIDLGDNKFLFPEVTITFWANSIGSQENSWPTYFVIREPDASACGIYWDKGSTEMRVFALKPGVIGEENLRDNESQVITDDDWHHITGVFSATSGRKIYIDGDLKAIDALFVGTPADLNGTNTYIARGRTHSPGEYVVGIIDEFLIAKGVLTEEEILRHRDMGVKGVLAVKPSGKLVTTWASIKGNK